MDVRKNFTIWFTGLTGAGKSTLSKLLYDQLLQVGVEKVELFDGDEVRKYLSNGLGFTRNDRDINVVRIAWVCQLLHRYGVSSIVAAISPYNDTRQRARALIDSGAMSKGTFIEIFVKCPLSECERRDMRGLYAKARRGEIKNVCGIDHSYEEPVDPEMILDSLIVSPEENVAEVMHYLEKKGHLAKTRGGSQ